MNQDQNDDSPCDPVAVNRDEQWLTFQKTLDVSEIAETPEINRPPTALPVDSCCQLKEGQSTPTTQHDLSDLLVTEADRPDGGPEAAAVGDLPAAVSESSSLEVQQTLAYDGDSFFGLDERSIKCDRVVSFVVATIVLVVGSVSLVILYSSIGLTSGFTAVATALGLVVVLCFTTAFFWPPAEHRNVVWRMDRYGLEIHKGVFWKHRVAVPLARIQHADVAQGPLQRFFGLGTLVLHTAGTATSSVSLSGLSHENARGMKDHVLRSREAAHVV